MHDRLERVLKDHQKKYRLEVNKIREMGDAQITHIAQYIVGKFCDELDNSKCPEYVRRLAPQEMQQSDLMRKIRECNEGCKRIQLIQFINKMSWHKILADKIQHEI